MWELDHKESWAPKNWCFWTVVLEKTLESPLDCKEIKPDNPKGNQCWIFIGRTDAEAETPYFGQLMWRTDSFAKTLMLGKVEDRNRGWDGWMVSLTQWTWVWVSSGSWWWTGKPGVLQSLRRWTELMIITVSYNICWSTNKLLICLLSILTFKTVYLPFL